MIKILFVKFVRVCLQHWYLLLAAPLLGLTAGYAIPTYFTSGNELRVIATFEKESDSTIETNSLANPEDVREREVLNIILDIREKSRPPQGYKLKIISGKDSFWVYLHNSHSKQSGQDKKKRETPELFQASYQCETTYNHTTSNEITNCSPALQQFYETLVGWNKKHIYTAI